MIAAMLDGVAGLLDKGAAPSALAALILGFMGIWLSPCHVTGLVIADRAGSAGGAHARRVFRTTFLVVVLAASAALAAGTLALGRIAGDTGDAGRWIGIAALALAGVVLLDVVRLPALVGVTRPVGAGPVARAWAFGAAFAATTGACTLAFVAPLLGAASVRSGAAPLSVYLGLFVCGHAAGALLVWALVDRLTGRCQATLREPLRLMRHAFGAALLGTASYAVVGALAG